MFRKKVFFAFQIEITNRCGSPCKMCIKSEYRDYEPCDMSLKDFYRLLPFLPLTEHVVLEGWGESLLHPDLLEFIRLSKKAGAKVGFVTSGLGLTEKKAEELLKEGIDFLGFSFAGATPLIHESIRPSSPFEELLSLLGYVVRLMGKYRNTKVHINYLLLRSNIEELIDIIEIAAKFRVEKINLLNIIQISNLSQYEERVFTYEPPNPYEFLFEEAKKIAREKGISLLSPFFVAREVALCAEDPLRNLYISADGFLSPCVFLYPPCPSPFRRIFKGNEVNIEKLSFGNIFEEDLLEIWEKESYKSFRKAFHQRKEREMNPLFSFTFPSTEFPSPPEVCKTCHKLFGL